MSIDPARRRVPFVCARCGLPFVKVIDTREWQGAIRRKRRCPGGHVVVTADGHVIARSTFRRVVPSIRESARRDG